MLRFNLASGSRYSLCMHSQIVDTVGRTLISRDFYLRIVIHNNQRGFELVAIVIIATNILSITAAIILSYACWHQIGMHHVGGCVCVGTRVCKGRQESQCWGARRTNVGQLRQEYG